MTTTNTTEFFRGERVQMMDLPGTIISIRNTNNGVTYTVRMDSGITQRGGPYSIKRI